MCDIHALRSGPIPNGFLRDEPAVPARIFCNWKVLVGLVMVDGWPITHHVFAGNWRDATTVRDGLDDLESRLGL